jgi:hypothetical protein
MKDISASRLSLLRPLGFPPHPREWFSIIGYLELAVLITTLEYTKL